MTTRAAQIELLTGPLTDPITGSICSGYSVEFYAAGTSTAKNVWTEKEKTNPFTTYTLDSGGKALLYGDGVYKIVIKNTDGTAVLTLDNQKIQATTFSVVTKTGIYTATPDDDVILCNGTFTLSLQAVANFERNLTIINIGAGTITIDPASTETIDSSATLSLATGTTSELFPDTSASMWRAGFSLGTIYAPIAKGVTNGDSHDHAGGDGGQLVSSSVNFLQAGTGAVTRTAQNKMRDIKSILDFGVVGDGTTDDTVAFQAAINDTKGIATLYLPLGKTYKLKNLTIYKGTHIVSDGPGYTTAPNLLFTAAGKDDSYGIKVDDGDGENIVLKGFTIEGDGTDSVAGFYIPSGKTMYYSDIDIGIKNFQYGCYCVGTLWSSIVKLYVEKAYIGMVRTADAYNTSLDLNLRIFRCFHGVLFHNTTYCQMWGFMEDCGLKASAYLPAAWKPADEAPICVSMYGGQLTINYLGTENTNAIYIEATGYANVKCSSLYAASLPADTWIYDAARNNNIAGDDQGLFSAHDGGFISLDNFTFAHLNADGYEVYANVLSYMFRIDAAPSSISVSNAYINIQDYWLVDLEERFIWDGSGNIIATMDDARVFGEWTPVLTTDTIDFTSVTYHADTFGTYRKIGNVVFFNGRIRTTAITVGSASGGLMITGIPLTPADATNPVLVSNATGFAATVPISAYLNSSGNIFPQYRTNPDGATSFCIYTTVSATNNDIFFSGSYLV